VLVLLNFSEKQIPLDLSDLSAKSAQLIFSDPGQVITEFPQMLIQSFELWITELKKTPS
jgi:hypothetical protein